MSDGIFLVITSAIVIEGEIAKVGEIVEVSEREAKNLLHRGKARLATEADGIPDEGVTADDVDESISVKLDRLNKTQLSELATQLGIEPGEMTKAELVAAIEAAQEAN
jgi:hypothetical protein